MIYTFYSFKGGVGRSMALANIAELFYRRGLKVLMIDFDLEAPGLERYFNVSDAQFTTIEIVGRRGVIDLLVSYKQMCSLPKMVQENAVQQNNGEETSRLIVEPLEDFCVQIYQENQSGGELFLIPAGRRSGDYFKKYAENVQGFDWQDFYINWEGERFFEWFRESVNLFADVVLIDSRTGITEMGGICTHQLADVVVMFVAANQQNLDGTLKMATSLSNKDLISNGRKGRELFLLPVPSRIDGFEAESLDEFAESFKNILGQFIPSRLNTGGHISTFFSDLKIPYVPYYSYQERVAVRESARESSIDLVRAFENLLLILLYGIFNSNIVNSSGPKSQLPINVFISYSHKDNSLRSELGTHLSNLKRQGKIAAWYDRSVEAGTEWNVQIKAKLESASVILLLVSSDFLASDYCYDIEIEKAIERHYEGIARVIPIILRPCYWQGSPFSKLQALPKNAKPVTLWEDRDSAFLDVVLGIRRAIDSLVKKQLADIPK
jgi:cellulose biosynthesis protein BcsQ